MKKADFIVIAVVALVAGIILFFLYGTDNTGNYVQVEINGQVVDTVSLSEDFEKEYKTENGGTNTLVIKDGKAVMTQADCPDGICKNHKPINRSGESIICLPHKLVVSVVDGSNDAEIDAVA